ncbi:MAG: hypothetical protein JWP69_1426 [Flaviaesturariibacter sp.]|nr:hypothetical protein [Flaviaesturariibacter sp.]
MNRLLFFAGLFAVLTSCAQDDKYNLKYYKELSRGSAMIEGAPFENTIIKQSTKDTNYSVKIIFDDSTYRVPQTIFYYFKGKTHGPFTSFVKGRIYAKGYYKNGQRDGERITYGGKFMSSKSYYKMGVKTGVWEYYDNKGKLIRKAFYDDGQLTQDVTY